MASRLAEAHILGQARLRGLTETAVQRIWESMPAYNRENIDEWLARVLPVIDTAQRSSASLTEAYLARSLGRQPWGIGSDEVTGAAVRSGVQPSEVYQRPFVTLWSALGDGAPFATAAAGALARARSSAAIDVQLAMRATANAVQEREPSIQGYVRVADAGACSFCSEVDGAFLKSADAMPLHNNCGCGVEPLTDPVRTTPTPPTVAVHQHGELGPVLADPAHDFTTAAQALS